MYLTHTNPLLLAKFNNKDYVSFTINIVNNNY
nr:MAG TPA: hypothetical protein [Crassvirales sp.]